MADRVRQRGSELGGWNSSPYVAVENQTGGGCVCPDVEASLGGDDDESLLRRVGSGDRAAFEVLYQRNAPWLAVRLRRRCRDDELAADLLQETFLSVWRMSAGFSGRGSAAGWIWTVASSRLVDAHRRRAVRPRVTGDVQPDVGTVASAEERALVNEYDDRLAAALAQLSPELRAVLQATVLDGLSTRETSVLLGVPEGTIKTRAMRARRILREQLA